MSSHEQEPLPGRSVELPEGWWWPSGLADLPPTSVPGTGRHDEGRGQSPPGNAALSPPSPSGRVLIVAALGLATVAALKIGGVIAQGLTLGNQGLEGFRGDLLHHVGYAFLTNVDETTGLVLVAALTLVVLAGSAAAGRVRSLALAVIGVIGAVVSVGAVLAVRAEVRFLRVSQQPVDVLARWYLYTYLVSALGTAAVAVWLLVAVRRGAAPPWRAEPQHAGPATISGSA